MTPRNAASLPGSVAYAVHLLCVCHATVITTSSRQCARSVGNTGFRNAFCNARCIAQNRNCPPSGEEVSDQYAHAREGRFLKIEPSHGHFQISTRANPYSIGVEEGGHLAAEAFPFQEQRAS